MRRAAADCEADHDDDAAAANPAAGGLSDGGQDGDDWDLYVTAAAYALTTAALIWDGRERWRERASRAWAAVRQRWTGHRLGNGDTADAARAPGARDDQDAPAATDAATTTGGTAVVVYNSGAPSSGSGAVNGQRALPAPRPWV